MIPVPGAIRSTPTWSGVADGIAICVRRCDAECRPRRTRAAVGSKREFVFMVVPFFVTSQTRGGVRRGRSVCERIYSRRQFTAVKRLAVPRQMRVKSEDEGRESAGWALRVASVNRTLYDHSCGAVFLLSDHSLS